MTLHPTDDLQSLALGDLDPVTSSAVMEHADSCTQCSAELADAIRGVAALAAATGAHDGRRMTRDRSALRVGWTIGSLAAAVVALALWNADLQLTAAAVPVEALVHSHFAHHALAGTGGQAKLVQALDGSWVYMIAVGLEPLRVYDVKVDGVTVGSMRADLSGDATGFWRRAPVKVTSAALAGPGSSLRWDGR